MRAFCISLSLFAAVLGLSIWNFAFVNNRTTAMLSLAESIPIPAEENDLAFVDAAEELAKFRALWEREKGWFGIGISYDTLAAVELALSDTEAYCLQGEVASYTAAHRTLLLAIERLAKLERSFF